MILQLYLQLMLLYSDVCCVLVHKTSTTTFPTSIVTKRLADEDFITGKFELCFDCFCFKPENYLLISKILHYICNYFSGTALKEHPLIFPTFSQQCQTSHQKSRSTWSNVNLTFWHRMDLMSQEIYTNFKINTPKARKKSTSL